MLGHGGAEPLKCFFPFRNAPPLQVMDMLDGYPHSRGVWLYPHKLQPHTRVNILILAFAGKVPEEHERVDS